MKRAIYIGPTQTSNPALDFIQIGKAETLSYGMTGYVSDMAGHFKPDGSTATWKVEPNQLYFPSL